jgi:hypothetical protein
MAMLAPLDIGSICHRFHDDPVCLFVCLFVQRECREQKDFRKLPKTHHLAIPAEIFSARGCSTSTNAWTLMFAAFARTFLALERAKHVGVVDLVAVAFVGAWVVGRWLDCRAC